jgi:protein-tyrosine phosphatase
VQVSRSASIVIAYLMYNKRMTYSEAFLHTHSRRQVIDPNDGFKVQLAEYAESLGLLA